MNVTQAVFQCDGAPVPNDVARKTPGAPYQIRSLGPEPSLTLHVQNLDTRVLMAVNDVLSDLVRIAAYVYAADQMVSRGGPKDIHLEDWRREMTLCVPVSAPGVWDREAVRRTLCAALNVASEDTWDFRFSQGEPTMRQLSIFPPETEQTLLRDPDSVLLFSGGADSLSAAVDGAVNRGLHPLLVSHFPSMMIGGRQERLWGALNKRSEWRFPYMGFHIFRSAGDPASTSQRVRPFLYASIGSAVAAQLGIGRVELADNGVVSLGLPINGSVIGAQTSRTTHFKFLTQFRGLLETLGFGSMTVENPLWRNTRAEALTILKDAGYAELVGLTYSCSHSARRPADKPQCGWCSQCIDRRFGMVAAGLESFDPASRYGVDIFFEAMPEGEARTLANSYLQFAREVNATSAEDLFNRRPELYQCIPTGAGSVEAASQIAALLKRHGQIVDGVIADMIGREKHRLGRGEIPSTSLVRLAIGESPHLPELPFDGNFFRREGELWTVSFDGVRVTLPRKKGMDYLGALVTRPGQSLEARLLEAEFSSENAAASHRGRTNEKARQSVSKAINGAITTIRLHHPALADHLVAAVHLGKSPVYSPSTPVDWRLSD